MPVQLNETPAEPWGHEQEMAVQRRLISTAKIVPREIAELEIQQMGDIGGGGQYLKADDAQGCGLQRPADGMIAGYGTPASSTTTSLRRLSTSLGQRLACEHITPLTSSWTRHWLHPNAGFSGQGLRASARVTPFPGPPSSTFGILATMRCCIPQCRRQAR